MDWEIFAAHQGFTGDKSTWYTLPPPPCDSCGRLPEYPRVSHGIGSLDAPSESHRHIRNSVPMCSSCIIYMGQDTQLEWEQHAGKITRHLHPNWVAQPRNPVLAAARASYPARFIAIRDIYESLGEKYIW